MNERGRAGALRERGARRLSGAVALAALLGAGAAPAWAQEQLAAAVAKVGRDGGAEATVLVDRGGEHGVSVGQTVEVRREGRTIGYGTVNAVFDDAAVATVGTVVTGASPLRAGDAVLLHGSGFTPPGKRPPRVVSEAPPANEARGEVISVREGVVILDFGANAGVEVGHEVMVQDAEGSERGRVALEVVDKTTSVGVLLAGEARRGDAALSLGPSDREHREGGLDFVALSFLGVVADLEHPTPHRAPCHLGLPVRRVLRGSPAEAAGIGPGDRVVAVESRIVREVAEIRERIESRRNDVVEVTVVRGDRLVTLRIAFR